ncbi:bifunctional ADP-dependent NAD(P)H-hydrate dehydratase/NAD(P)H-hydrate epimerase [Zhihengliuella alba]|uniref:Bifunctional NAD(P)H-hydrate repair enzyme n=1 Tax=Zhihengliuella alba TaxID=547018 RepID=A0ABP7D1I5_9MICC
MIDVYTGTEVRAAERPLLDAGHGPALMKRAAYALAQHTAAVLRDRAGRVYGAHVVAFVGKGNNGGDGLHALAMLRRRGVAATAVLLGPDAHADGMRALREAGGRIIRAEGDLTSREVRAAVDGADVVIDAVLGTGTRVPAPAADNAETRRPGPLAGVDVGDDAYVIACDLPSGVDADTGAATEGVLRADSTVTFGALKSGLVVGAGATLSGRIETVDIGLGEYLGEPAARLMEKVDVVDTALEPDAHKYSRGVLGLVAGSDQYPGAAVLSATSAVNAGLGMLYVIAEGRARERVGEAVPESVAMEHSAVDRAGPASRVSAWAMGPGIGEDARQHGVIKAVLASSAERGTPCVVDASALQSLKPIQTRAERPFAVLTPHAGELRRLLSAAGEDVTGAEIAHDPVRWARCAAEAYGAVVLLKGPSTVCAATDGEVRVVHAAPATLATAGSGDVLTGLVGQTLATHPPVGLANLLACAATAAYRHAEIARSLGAGGFGARRLADAVR